MEFVNLKRQYQQFKNEIDSSIQKVIESSEFILGKEVIDLERNLSNFTESPYVVTCSSGTDGILLALRALEIGPGDEVITSPFTFIAAAEAIALVGAKPVFVDIDEKTYNIDSTKIQSAITHKTKAIITISLFGQPADMDEINRLGQNHKLLVIEDACQSFGASYKGKKSGNLSSIGVTSFFPSKPLGCYGDGGAVFTNDEKLATKIRSLRTHGQGKRYEHQYIGMNSRLDNLQAAVLNIKLKYFSGEIEARQMKAAFYNEGLKHNKKIITPFIKQEIISAYAQYSVRVKNRAEVILFLQQSGIPTAIHYPKPIHLQECFSMLGGKIGDFPNAEIVSSEILSLPFCSFINESEQAMVIDKLAQI